MYMYVDGDWICTPVYTFTHPLKSSYIRTVQMMTKFRKQMVPKLRINIIFQTNTPQIEVEDN